jgi:Dockerin type I domain
MIVANNSAATAPDVLGAMAVNFSLIRNQTGATISGGNNLPAGTDPLFGPLANNGGPTATIALRPGSPAINAGSNPAGLTTDQRGLGFTRAFGASVDIGAFEAPRAVQSVVVDAGGPQRSMVTSVTLTFNGPVTFNGPATNAFRLTGIGPAGGNVALAIDLSGSTAAQTVARLTFSGPLTEGPGGPRSLTDGNYELTVFGSQINGGLPGGDYVTPIFRLYGDANGDKVVNVLDLIALRNTFGTIIGNPGYVSYLDSNGDGAINVLDLVAFRARFGATLP